MQNRKSKALNLRYSFDGERYRFEDGVTYSLADSFSLSRLFPKELRAIHCVMKVFQGEIIFPKPQEAQQSMRYYTELCCRCGGGEFRLLRRKVVAIVRCKECRRVLISIPMHIAGELVALCPGYEWERDEKVEQTNLW